MNTINAHDDVINIVIIGITEIRDELLPKALPLMGRNLDQFQYLQNKHGVIQTGPIQFDFANKPLTFQETGDDDDRVRDNIVPHCHGAIISLRMVAPDFDYLKHKKGAGVHLLLRYNEIVYRAKLPVICVLEDNQDSFQRVMISDFNLVENPDEDTWMRPPNFVKPIDNIWQPHSKTIQATRTNLKIPKSISILPYSYRRPESFRNILATLLHEIDPGLVMQPELLPELETKPLKIAVIGLTDPQDSMAYLHDPMLYHAFLLMSLNLDKATYHTDDYGFDNTIPLRFSFTNESFVFSKHPTTFDVPDIAERIRDALLPMCDGVIVNVYGASSNTLPHRLLFLNEIYAQVYDSKLPAIFVQRSGSERRIANTRQMLNVPEHIPFISYHYDTPTDIQNILLKLLAEIDKVGKK